MPKKICFFTGTRAEYGLLRPLIHLLNDQKEIDVQILVSGTHLSIDFGETWQEIQADDFVISEKVEILTGDTSEQGICTAMGLAMQGYGNALNRLAPDLLVVLGDRYEALAVAIAATVYHIPIAHIHGGELTLGAMDDAFRHAITKMSHLHFTSSKEHQDRVIQMGEMPTSVFNVGAIGVENVLNIESFSREAVEERVGISSGQAYFLVTYHPVTLDPDPSLEGLKHLLGALEEFSEFSVIFTGANADPEGQEINKYLQEYVAKHCERCRFFMSLGSKLYFSAAKYASLVIGNSSSGIIEIPSLGVPVVNLGNRQSGRLQSGDIVNCDGKKTDEIEKAIKSALTKELTKVNPYEKQGTAQAIADRIANWNFYGKLQKTFYSFTKQIL